VHPGPYHETTAIPIAWQVLFFPRRAYREPGARRVSDVPRRIESDGSRPTARLAPEGGCVLSLDVDISDGRLQQRPSLRLRLCRGSGHSCRDGPRQYQGDCGAVLTSVVRQGSTTMGQGYGLHN